MPATRPQTSRDKVSTHRERLRRQGLRPFQMWVADVRCPAGMRDQNTRRQSLAVAHSPHAHEDQDFIDIWTVAGGKGYAGKPRPALILQDHRFRQLDSITLCPFTTDPTFAPCSALPSNPAPATDRALPASLWWTKSQPFPTPESESASAISPTKISLT